jgi:uncharacterized protein
VRWLFVLLLACSSGSRRDDAKPQTDLPAKPSTPPATVTLTTPQGDIPVQVEVVQSPAKLQQGLMYREHLPADAGMLFLMGAESDHAFFMKNTLIPLDMIFITKDMTIAGIVENAEPKTLTLRKVGALSSYVLEVNGGWTAAHHVTAGAKVRFDNVTAAAQ